MSSNAIVGIEIPQAKSFDARREAAEQFCSASQTTVPVVVDGIDNRVGEAYSGFPDRLYLIDPAGRVAYKGGRGPFGYKPGELEQALVMCLLDESLAQLPVAAAESEPAEEGAAGEPPASEPADAAAPESAAGEESPADSTP